MDIKYDTCRTGRDYGISSGRVISLVGDSDRDVIEQGYPANAVNSNPGRCPRFNATAGAGGKTPIYCAIAGGPAMRKTQ